MFLFINYYSDTFRPQFLAVFGELVFFYVSSLCVNLFGTRFTHVNMWEQ